MGPEILKGTPRFQAWFGLGLSGNIQHGFKHQTSGAMRRKPTKTTPNNVWRPPHTVGHLKTMVLDWFPVDAAETRLPSRTKRTHKQTKTTFKENQPTKQTNNQPTNQPTNQPSKAKQSKQTSKQANKQASKQPNKQTSKQTINQSINQSINQ